MRRRFFTRPPVRELAQKVEVSQMSGGLFDEVMKYPTQGARHRSPHVTQGMHSDDAVASGALCGVRRDDFWK